MFRADTISFPLPSCPAGVHEPLGNYNPSTIYIVIASRNRRRSHYNIPWLSYLERVNPGSLGCFVANAPRWRSVNFSAKQNVVSHKPIARYHRVQRHAGFTSGSYDIFLPSQRFAPAICCPHFQSGCGLAGGFPEIYRSGSRPVFYWINIYPAT